MNAKSILKLSLLVVIVPLFFFIMGRFDVLGRAVALFLIIFFVPIVIIRIFKNSNHREGTTDVSNTEVKKTALNKWFFIVMWLILSIAIVFTLFFLALSNSFNGIG